MKWHMIKAVLFFSVGFCYALRQMPACTLPGLAFWQEDEPFLTDCPRAEILLMNIWTSLNYLHFADATDEELERYVGDLVLPFFNLYVYTAQEHEAYSNEQCTHLLTQVHSLAESMAEAFRSIETHDLIGIRVVLHELELLLEESIKIA